jgi:membrane-associated phospholipid phosphatase
MTRGIGSADMDMDMDMDMDARTASPVITTDGVVRPIGVSPVLQKLPNEDWYHGDKWPPVDAFVSWKNAAPKEFPRAYWSSYHYSFTVLAEFVAITDAEGDTKWNSPTLEKSLDQILPKNKALINKELTELVELIEYRPGVMSEALAQRENLWAYFSGIFLSDSWSAPYTRDLVAIAGRVGQFQAMYYKRLFSRPRASQYSPALLPPIHVPGHASFPSGHATEAYLIALCLKEVMPSAACTPAGDDSPLVQMARRIARNREVLGLHFPSDSKAGRHLAEETFKILMECDSINDPKNGIIARAKMEWWP